ncbi:hypothetical protein [Bacillus glycinifermentans]|nr:hypothetical protein [Bacillus glycinifermentans]
MENMKESRRKHNKWDFFPLADLVEPLFYLLRWAFKGIIKIIN